MNKKIFLILTAIMLLSPIAAFASGTYKAWSTLSQIGSPTTICYEGLVPCGKELYRGELVDGKCAGSPEDPAIPCQFCHFFIMFVGIIDFFLLPPGGLVWIIGVTMIVLAGAMYVFGMTISPGDPKMIKNANNVLTSTIMGLALCLAAYILVNTIFVFIGAKDLRGDGKGWFEIDCPVYIEPYAQN